ncbi:MAG: alpha/beta hydrolase [Anaerolineae bacterium]|nr:alpha/beta hydrolase [Anaerolineae bacterium]
MAGQQHTTNDLYVQEVGPVNAPTLVFLHGGGGAGWMWRPQVEALQADYHILAPDLPEHGRSLHVKPFTIPDAAKRVADLIRSQAHGGKAHVIGLSEGAQVGVQLLATAPEVVERAILSSPLLHPLPGAAMYTPGIIRATFLSTVAPLKWSQWYARINMKWAAGVPEAYFPQFLENFRQINADSFTHVLIGNMRFRQPAGLERVTVPTLVIVGKNEYKPMHQSVRDLVKTLPNVRGAVVSLNKRLAEEHNWNMNAPDLFTRTVRAWVEDKPLPAELLPLEGSEKA